MSQIKELTLVCASGKIKCLRCTAKSKRTGEQCGAPALRDSKTQKCRIHGGKSTGPKTEAVKGRFCFDIKPTNKPTNIYQILAEFLRACNCLIGLKRIILLVLIDQKIFNKSLQ
jgi:hypothetical protein